MSSVPTRALTFTLLHTLLIKLAGYSRTSVSRDLVSPLHLYTLLEFYHDQKILKSITLVQAKTCGSRGHTGYYGNHCLAHKHCCW